MKLANRLTNVLVEATRAGHLAPSEAAAVAAAAGWVGSQVTEDEAGRRGLGRVWARELRSMADAESPAAMPADPAAAFVAACRGSDPDVSALDWLGALLAELEGEEWASRSTDPEAAGMALGESRRLLDGLRATVAATTDQ